MTGESISKGLFWAQQVGTEAQLHAPQTVDSLTATHSGASGVCPASVSRQGPCNNGRSSCVDGLCSGSVCLNNNLEDCQCTGNQAQLCHVCCIVNGVCQSTFSLSNMVKLHFYLSLSSSPPPFYSPVFLSCFPREDLVLPPLITSVFPCMHCLIPVSWS